MPIASKLGLLALVSAFVLTTAAHGGDERAVCVEIFEGLPKKWDWSPPATPPVEVDHTPILAMVRLPARDTARGIEIDRVTPLALHATTLRAPAGRHRLLLRARHAARLVVDGHVVAETRPITRNSSGHEPVPPAVDPEDLRWHAPPPSVQERLVDWEFDSQDHRVEL